MSPQGQCRETWKASHARRILDADESCKLKEIFWNPYKKRYVHRKERVKRNTQQQSKLITISTKTNENKWIGDTMTELVSNNCTRFWLQNCRGLPTTKDKNWFQYDMCNIVKNNIHYYSLPEANINVSNTEIVSHIQQVHYNIVQSGTFTITNTPAYPHQHRRQPGGIASGFYGRLENRYAKTVKDK